MGLLASVLKEVVLKVEPRLEGLVAAGAAEVPYVLVEGVDVGLQPTWFGEALAAQLAADLMADAVGAEVVAERVAVRVFSITHIALGCLVCVGLFVHRMGGLVGKPFGAKVTDEAALLAASAASQLGPLLSVAVHVRKMRVPAHVQPQVAAEVLHVGEASKAGEADQLLPPALQLLFSQGQPRPRQQTTHCPPLL